MTITEGFDRRLPSYSGARNSPPPQPRHQLGADGVGLRLKPFDNAAGERACLRLQKLYGNVGFRLMEANIQELLRAPGTDEASWC